MDTGAGWANSVHYADLTCTHCGECEPHELRYVGRLLAYSVCMNCGLTLRSPNTDLRKAYLKDLEQRLRTKPIRMARRAVRHPAKFMRDLPCAMLAKPALLIEEVKPLLDAQSARGR